MTADHTAPEQRAVVGRPFPPGQSGNPAGRPKGARSVLATDFLNALVKTFNEPVPGTDRAAGIDAIRAVRDTDPAAYTRVIASILPREITGEDGTPLLTNITVQFVHPQLTHEGE